MHRSGLRRSWGSGAFDQERTTNVRSHRMLHRLLGLASSSSSAWNWFCFSGSVFCICAKVSHNSHGLSDQLVGLSLFATLQILCGIRFKRSAGFFSILPMAVETFICVWLLGALWSRPGPPLIPQIVIGSSMFMGRAAGSQSRSRIESHFIASLNKHMNIENKYKYIVQSQTHI